MLMRLLLESPCGWVLFARGMYQVIRILEILAPPLELGEEPKVDIITNNHWFNQSCLWQWMWSEGHSVLSTSLWPHGLYSPWNSPGQNTGVGSLSLLQGIFPTLGLNPDLPYCRWILYQLSHQGSPARNEASLKIHKERGRELLLW